jgi:RNA polymerase sigma-70 factor (ECF subfamily)
MKQKPDFEELVSKHSEELFVFLWRMMSDAKDAQDCLQDSLLRAYRAYSRLDESANTRAWLYKIANNTALTQLKRHKNQAAQAAILEERIASIDTPAEQLLEQNDALHSVRQAVLALPHKQRAALMMRKYQELTYKEISLALNCSEESARANVYQGLRKLRKKLANEVNV